MIQVLLSVAGGATVSATDFGDLKTILSDTSTAGSSSSFQVRSSLFAMGEMDPSSWAAEDLARLRVFSASVLRS